MNLDLLREVPIFGPLYDAKCRHHWNALKDVFPKTVLSLLPIILGAIFQFYFANSENISTVLCGNGELFMYATSLLSSIFIIVTNDRRNGTRFPGGRGHLFVVLFFVAISGLLFAMRRLDIKPNQNIEFYHASVGFYIVALALFYLATVYEKTIESVTHPGQQETDFTKKFAMRHR